MNGTLHLPHTAESGAKWVIPGRFIYFTPLLTTGLSFEGWEERLLGKGIVIDQDAVGIIRANFAPQVSGLSQSIFIARNDHYGNGDSSRVVESITRVAAEHGYTPGIQPEAAFLILDNFTLAEIQSWNDTVTSIVIMHEPFVDSDGYRHFLQVCPFNLKHCRLTTHKVKPGHVEWSSHMGFAFQASFKQTQFSFEM